MDGKDTEYGVLNRLSSDPLLHGSLCPTGTVTSICPLLNVVLAAFDLALNIS
jgi:hypothetical protein